MPQGMMSNMPMQLPESFWQEGCPRRCSEMSGVTGLCAGWSIGVKILNLEVLGVPANFPQ